MSANLFEETRMSDLNRATGEYQNAKENYQRLLRLAIEEQDPARREEAIRGVQAENARLVRVVEGLAQGWSQYDTPASKDHLDELEQELEQFKEDMKTIRNRQDKVTQLKSVLSSLTSQNESDRNTYYGYIIAVLILLILVFIFFVYSYAASVISSLSAEPTTIQLSVPE